MRWVHDVFGNCVTIAEFPAREAEELRFESNIWLDHTPSNTPDFQIEDYAKTYPFAYARRGDAGPRAGRSARNTPTRTTTVAPLGAPLPAQGPARPIPACC